MRTSASSIYSLQTTNISKAQWHGEQLAAQEPWQDGLSAPREPITFEN